MKSAQTYVPDRGDVVWIDFDPQRGHEQSGRRPAIVLSDAFYNSRSGLVVVCPITNKSKGYVYEVAIPAGHSVTGVVLADQVKSLDWQARNAVLQVRLPDPITDQVSDKMHQFT